MKTIRFFYFLSIVLAIVACQPEMPATDPATTEAVAGEGLPKDGDKHAINCPGTASTNPQLQATYLGIIPGSTKRDQVDGFAGQPIKKEFTDSSEVWHYDHFIVNIDNNTVKDIQVFDEYETVLEFVQQHGCPDIVLFVSVPGDEGTQYLIFPYFSQGIQFYSPEFFTSEIRPVDLLSPIEGLLYFQPVSSLGEYFIRFDFLRSDDIKTVTWGQAVR